ncbi:UTRA domain-containing protein [Streptomyces sp. NPDC001165]|uniref:UTRA domain-containing protein n=1 Tax=Streptomyces sp. NPDC001165 TaxID=3364546 RepID=UPI00369A9981
MQAAGQRVVDDLDLRVGDQVGVGGGYSLDDLPVAVEHAVFPATLDALLTADLETDSLHQTLRRLGLHPTLGSSVLTARTADQDAPELDVDPTTPMLVETRSIVDQHSNPLEFTVSSYAAHRYALKVDFSVAAPSSSSHPADATPATP